MESEKIEKEVNKTCENCKYFNRHYYFRNCQLHKTCYGHCINSNTRSGLLIDNKVKNCSHWELAEDKNETKQKNVKKVLEEIERKLGDINYYLSCKE